MYRGTNKIGRIIYQPNFLQHTFEGFWMIGFLVVGHGNVEQHPGT